MAYQVLARKWRPTAFNEVVGQDHIIRSLKNNLAANRIGHAYLFCGTRGVGKTTIARIFAKSIRCENRDSEQGFCGSCEACQDEHINSSLNIIEIDGASNNTVDEVRELISNVQYLPTVGKYKIYIIDEVHMLSKSAFNALLKTLEEPPEHVVFLFATTEPEKLLGTVLSRCQRFDLKSVPIEELFGHLSKISKEEGVKISDESLLREVCRGGNGSVRDTLSLMDQVLSYSIDSVVNDEVVSKALGVASSSTVKKLLESLLREDSKTIFPVVDQIFSENISPKSLIKSLLDRLFSVIENLDNREVLSDLIEPEVIAGYEAAELFWIYEHISKETTWIFESLYPVQAVTLLLQKISSRSEILGLTRKEVIVEKKTEKVQAKVVEEIAPKQEAKVEPKAEEKIGPTKKEAVEEEKVEKTNTTYTWDSLLEYIYSKSPAFAANLEQGNLVGTFEKTDAGLNIEVGFDKEAKVFYDYLVEHEYEAKLKDYIYEYTKWEKSIEISVSINLLSQKEKEEKNFSSKAQIRKDENIKKEELQKQEILEDPFIKEAEQMFQSKVDRVIIEKS